MLDSRRGEQPREARVAFILPKRGMNGLEVGEHSQDQIVSQSGTHVEYEASV